jgi:hypothetical protein
MKVIIKENQWEEIENEITELVKNYKTEIEIGLHIGKDGFRWNHLYHHQVIEMSEILRETAVNTINSLLPSKEVEFEISQVWLNWMGENTNPNDAFHRDHERDIVLLHYPKCVEDYVGGELQWVEDEATPNEKIMEVKPGKGMNVLLLECPQHRVKNVTSGNRYSIIFFCKKIFKKRFL